LLLAAIGAYGLVSQGIAHRMRDIGIRLALGARPTALVFDIARRTVAAGAIGVAGGCGAALMLATPIESVLYGVRATDATSFVWAGAMFIAVTAVAALVPSGAARPDRDSPRGLDRERVSKLLSARSPSGYPCDPLCRAKSAFQNDRSAALQGCPRGRWQA
jgi:hypothetical protein